jgi:anaerobic ribonucleoside-triphosphate reductase activating protein
MNIIRRIKETCADGPDIRYSIYLAGCTHGCDSCHNPESWDFTAGELMTNQIIEEIKEDIINNSILGGITISGGDPMDNASGLLHLLQELAPLNKNIWVYTGYTIEEILNTNVDTDMIMCLKYIDILVDGEYKKEFHDTSDFKGSTNQRFILAKECLINYKKNGRVLTEVLIRK